MKILLLVPCLKDEIRPHALSIPQLTLSLIAGMTPAGHEIAICEETYGDIVDYEGDYDLIGISLMTQNCLRGYEIANEFKKRGKKVVFGGIHASAMPEEAIMYGDAVVIGEAEGGLWEEVLEDAKKDKLRSYYKLDKLPNLEKHTPPDRKLIRSSKGPFKIAPIETSRGCPYDCDFCTATKFFGKKQRRKLIRDIIIDAESCPQKQLFFVDDNIALNRKFAIELFTEMIPLKKMWVGQSSINLSKDEELMRLANKSGCRALLVGFESITDNGIGAYRKTLKTIEENVQAVKKLRDHGILTMAALIFGLDSDSEKVFDISNEFLEKSKSAFFQACIMTPYPGTPVFDRLRSAGRILSDDWSKFDTKKIVIEPENMTPERLLAGYNDIRKSIYGYKSIFKRSLPHVKLGTSESMLYFALNKGARKRYKETSNDHVYRNPESSPVDFDITKYVKPYKKTVLTTLA